MASPNFHDDVFDGALDILALATRVDITQTEPTTRTEAITTYTLGNYTLTAGDGGGDWTIANGDTSGRKITLGAQSGNNATGTGTATFVAFTDATRLLGVIDGDGDTVNSGSPFTIAATDVWEIADPT
jgi:hypothetical protein